MAQTKAQSKSASKSRDSGTQSSVKSFTGTSTGRSYDVGQSYSTSRGTVVAQSDGTFRNVNTGQVRRGSSDAVAEATTFRGGGGGNASNGYYGGKQTVKVTFGSGPGNSGVATGGGRGATTGPGVAKVASKAGFFSGVAGDIETQLLYWDGKKLNTRGDISDGGDFEQRWGEWGGAMAGLGVMFSDLGNMANAELERQATRGQNLLQENWDKTHDPVTGKPDYMSDNQWLQRQLNIYANNERLTRAHETGLGAVIGNPMEPGGLLDFGSWWK